MFCYKVEDILTVSPIKMSERLGFYLSGLIRKGESDEDNTFTLDLKRLNMRGIFPHNLGRELRDVNLKIIGNVGYQLGLGSENCEFEVTKDVTGNNLGSGDRKCIYRIFGDNFEVGYISEDIDKNSKVYHKDKLVFPK